MNPEPPTARPVVASGHSRCPHHPQLQKCKFAEYSAAGVSEAVYTTGASQSRLKMQLRVDLDHLLLIVLSVDRLKQTSY